MTDTPDYRQTVFLPATPFPMRGDLPKREPDLLARWNRIGLWGRPKAAHSCCMPVPSTPTATSISATR